MLQKAEVMLDIKAIIHTRITTNKPASLSRTNDSVPRESAIQTTGQFFREKEARDDGSLYPEQLRNICSTAYKKALRTICFD